MENTYKFWNKYLEDLKIEINKLCEEKKELIVDLHIHSNYSADGKQTVKQILQSTRDKGFDLISITDHDSVEVYNEVYDLVKDGLTKPLIIPGIEFTADNKEYGNQCHILQLLINPKDKELLKNVDKNYEAMFNRSKIQFKRLKENKAIIELLKKHKIRISYDEYINYIYLNEMVPEYDTLCSYLMDKFKKSKITTFDILKLLEKYNTQDPYKDRLEFKKNRYKKLREKYKEIEENLYNTRFLLSMLAVREVDDDWWDEPSSGSLSVNSYGQIKIEELNERFITIFAHPTESSLSVVDKIIKNKKTIIGLENNIRNEYKDISKFYNILNKYNLCEIKGSDSHDNSLVLYENMSFYKVNSNNIKELLRKE